MVGGLARRKPQPGHRTFRRGHLRPQREVAPVYPSDILAERAKIAFSTKWFGSICSSQLYPSTSGQVQIRWETTRVFGRKTDAVR